MARRQFLGAAAVEDAQVETARACGRFLEPSNGDIVHRIERAAKRFAFRADQRDLQRAPGPQKRYDPVVGLERIGSFERDSQLLRLWREQLPDGIRATVRGQLYVSRPGGAVVLLQCNGDIAPPAVVCDGRVDVVAVDVKGHYGCVIDGFADADHGDVPRHYAAQCSGIVGEDDAPRRLTRSYVPQRDGQRPGDIGR